MMVLGESGSSGQSAGSGGSAGAGNSGAAGAGTSGQGNGDAGAGAAGSSSAGSGDAGKGAAGAAAAGGTASWRDTLPPEIKDNPTLALYSDITNLAKAHIHAQGLVGKKGVFVPGEKASEDDWKKFYTELGQPGLDKFDVKLPDGVKPNEAFVTKFKENAHKAGLLPKQAQGLMDWYLAEQKSEVQAQEQAMAQETTQGLIDLKKEWGNAYDGRLKQANAALDMAEKVPGLEGVKEYLKENGLSQDPVVIKLIQWSASLMGEGKLVGDGSGKFGQTPAEMEAEISKYTSDLKSPLYDRHHADHNRVNDLVAEMRKKLYDAKQSA